MLITEKNQYPKSGYHPDSSLKTHFHISKITKSAKIDKKGKSVENLGGKLKMRFGENTNTKAIVTLPKFVLT